MSRPVPLTSVSALPLGASVGISGANVPADALRVQDALNTLPPSQGAPGKLLTLDGVVGPLTRNAIQQLQLKHFGWKGADGRIDPGGRTATLLSKLLLQYGSTTWNIRRVESAVASQGSTGRTLNSQDRFLEIADTSGVRRALYYFVSIQNPLLARAHTIPQLRHRPEFCVFHTDVPCGPFSFAGMGSYSEFSPDARHAFISLSVKPAAGHVVGGQFLFQISHAWIEPMTTPGRVDIQGYLQFVRDESSGERKLPKS